MQIALLVAAGAAFLGAFALRSVKPDKVGAAWALFGAGALLAGTAFVIPNLTDGPRATVAFASPQDGDTVLAGQPVTIEIDLRGGELASSPSDAGGHLHILVDGSVITMPSTTTAEIDLEPGEHELKVEYVDVTHASFDPPIQETITVTAEKGN